MSGGLDSRLIISKLAELGHKRIIAFSYGPKGSFEVKIAKKFVKFYLLNGYMLTKPQKIIKIILIQKIKKFWKFCDFYSTLSK